MTQPTAAPPSSAAEQRLGIAAIGLAAALWAYAAVVARDLFSAGVEPVELAESRAIVAFGGFALLTAARVGRRDAPTGRGLPYAIALGLAIAFVNAVYYLAIERLDVAVALVLQYTAPAIVVAWTALVARRAPAPEVIAALVAAVGGVVLVVELPAGNLGHLDAAGIAFGLASATLFAAYSLLAEKAGGIYGATGAMLRAFTAASIFWVGYQAFNGWPAELFEAANLPRVLFVGVFGTLAPFLLFVWAVRHVAPERATIAATLEPVLAAVFAWLLLDQSLGAMQIAGGVLVIVAVGILQARRAGRLLAPEP